jgi:uncharacterized protein with gpF-like domain
MATQPMPTVERYIRKPKLGEPPERAIDFFRSKGIKPSFDFRDVWAEEHAHAFAAAGAMEEELIESLREEVERSLDQGKTFEQFRKDLFPRLAEMGWWGERTIEDPRTGRKRKVDFGSPERLKTIYFHNMRSARSVGQWSRFETTKEALPFLIYQLGPAEEHRELHVSWDGTMLPIDDPWWNDHMPPNGWNCHCHVRQMGHVETRKKGGPTSRPPRQEIEVIHRKTGRRVKVDRGVDPEWSFNPGKMRYNPKTGEIEPIGG